MFDTSLGSLVLQRLGFFGDMALKRTTNSFEIWRNILYPEKMMDREALMVLVEWTIYGCLGKDKLGLTASQSKTWLVDRSLGTENRTPTYTTREMQPMDVHQRRASVGYKGGI